MNGVNPVRSSKNTQPRDHTSDLRSYYSPMSISGAMIKGVPQYVFERSPSSSSLANPRSAILKEVSFVRSAFLRKPESDGLVPSGKLEN